MEVLINGVSCDTINVSDRGLLYGDGVFRTLLLRNGKLLQWHRHYIRLFKDCNIINLKCPPEPLLYEEISRLIKDAQDGVIKIVITRGSSQRGYAPDIHPAVTRILILSPIPELPKKNSQSGVRLHICQIRLGHQPLLAGAKHLNRLENVLAAAEWDNPDFAEGLLLDESGFVIEGVRSNIFLVKDGDLITPDLSRCGVSGVQRERLIEWAAQQDVKCKSIDVSMEDLLQADEIFLVNSVIGLWPVREMPGYQCDHHPVSKIIQDWLSHEYQPN